VASKAAVFCSYPGRIGGKIACQPRRYVAGKIFGAVFRGLWMTDAAAQRLAF
jgi:hypothetical protein